ncbi:PucR family transcriptional regulator [Glutamicibacter sp. NPDC087344]|uniref:PucR family transcriptional regulator n=1 Tax=Glutamicibacter sp. NPDC087344 TaxID=3363994 RepID=UPI00382A7103
MGHFAPELGTLDSADLGFDRPWDSITLHRFLRQLPAGIQVLHDAGDRPLRWVEPSDIDDPTDYLVDDELILTSGYPLVAHAEDQRWVDQFVHRLAQAKVCALGFGLEPYFSQVPDTLLTACLSNNVTLLQIPNSVPFAAIGLAFAKLMEADGAALLRTSAESNRALMRCVSQNNPEEQLVSTLAHRANCSVKLLDSTGRVRFSADNPNVLQLAAEPGTELFTQAALGEGASQFALLREGISTHLAFPIRASAARGQAPLLGVLQVGFPKDPSGVEHTLMATTLGLLEVVARERAMVSFTSAQLSTSLLTGSPQVLDEQQLTLLNLSLGPHQRKPLRALVLAPSKNPGGDDVSRHLAHLRILLESELVSRQSGAYIALSKIEPTDAAYRRLSKAGYLAAFSRPAVLSPGRTEELGQLLAQARGLMPQVMEKQKSMDAAKLPRTFQKLLPKDAGRELAQEVLGGVLELPAKRRELYLEVLRCWLDSNGSWDETSKRLDLHRNSVRRHISSIAQYLDADLGSAEVRNELFFALRFLP